MASSIISRSTSQRKSWNLLVFPQMESLSLGLRSLPDLGAGLAGPYYEEVVLIDERRFLHDESGSRPVKRDPAAFTIPTRTPLEWRKLALEAGGEEHRVVENSKTIVDIPQDIAKKWKEMENSAST